MARPLRIEYEGAWYHVVNRGAGKRDIYHTDAHRNHFLQLIGEIHDRFGVETHAYCLMGNHYHLLLHTPQANLSRAMRHLDGVYTQHFNRCTGADGPLFRGRYRSIVVDADTYLLEVSRYIHRNPLEAGLVDNLVAWEWSSYPAYIERTPAPEWLYGAMIRTQFGNAPERYRAFVEHDAKTDADEQLGRPGRLPVLGGEEFREQVLQRFNGNPGETADLRRPSVDLVTPTHIVNRVANAMGVDPESIHQSRRGPGNGNAPRLMAMYLCQQVAQMRLNEIRESFGLSHYGSVASAIDRYRRLRDGRSDVREAEAAARSELKSDH